MACGAPSSIASHQTLENPREKASSTIPANPPGSIKLAKAFCKKTVIAPSQALRGEPVAHFADDVAFHFHRPLTWSKIQAFRVDCTVSVELIDVPRRIDVPRNMLLKNPPSALAVNGDPLRSGFQAEESRSVPVCRGCFRI